jgi:hypothetical protein
VAKPRTNLSESRLARNLVERGLVGGDVIETLFQSCSESQGLLTEALVREGLLSDWELSRISGELFGLPFLPVDVHKPTEAALEGLDPEFLKRWCLVPLARNAELLTVAIPGAISPQVHEELSRSSGCELAIVIGSVSSNRHWLTHNL